MVRMGRVQRPPTIGVVNPAAEVSTAKVRSHADESPNAATDAALVPSDLEADRSAHACPSYSQTKP